MTAEKPSAFTVIGAAGFVGRHLVDYLQARGHVVNALDRTTQGTPTGPLGHVIDCGGLTADFRSRRDEIFEAHVSRIDRLLAAASFDSYLYLSSTRIYKNSRDTSEDASLEVRPAVFDDSYNISKIAGESVCLIREGPTVRVARLSNVLGPNPDPAVFLTALIAGAKTGHLRLQESLDSSKDYVAIEDVCRYLMLIALQGQERLYNLAYGENRTHRQILDCLGLHLSFTFEAPEQPTRAFPPVDNHRLVSEFGPPLVAPEEAIAAILARRTE